MSLSIVNQIDRINSANSGFRAYHVRLTEKCYLILKGSGLLRRTTADASRNAIDNRLDRSVAVNTQTLQISGAIKGELCVGGECAKLRIVCNATDLVQSADGGVIEKKKHNIKQIFGVTFAKLSDSPSSSTLLCRTTMQQSGRLENLCMIQERLCIDCTFNEPSIRHETLTGGSRKPISKQISQSNQQQTQQAESLSSKELSKLKTHCLYFLAGLDNWIARRELVEQVHKQIYGKQQNYHRSFKHNLFDKVLASIGEKQQRAKVPAKHHEPHFRLNERDGYDELRKLSSADIKSWPHYKSKREVENAFRKLKLSKLREGTISKDHLKEDDMRASVITTASVKRKLDNKSEQMVSTSFSSTKRHFADKYATMTTGNIDHLQKVRNIAKTSLIDNKLTEKQSDAKANLNYMSASSSLLQTCDQSNARPTNQNSCLTGGVSVCNDDDDDVVMSAKDNVCVMASDRKCEDTIWCQSSIRHSNKTRPNDFSNPIGSHLAALKSNLQENEKRKSTMKKDNELYSMSKSSKGVTNYPIDSAKIIDDEVAGKHWLTRDGQQLPITDSTIMLNSQRQTENKEQNIPANMSTIILTDNCTNKDKHNGVCVLNKHTMRPLPMEHDHLTNIVLNNGVNAVDRYEQIGHDNKTLFDSVSMSALDYNSDNETTLLVVDNMKTPKLETVGSVENMLNYCTETGSNNGFVNGDRDNQQAKLPLSAVIETDKSSITINYEDNCIVNRTKPIDQFINREINENPVRIEDAAKNAVHSSGQTNQEVQKFKIPKKSKNTDWKNKESRYERETYANSKRQKYNDETNNYPNSIDFPTKSVINQKQNNANELGEQTDVNRLRLSTKTAAAPADADKRLFNSSYNQSSTNDSVLLSKTSHFVTTSSTEHISEMYKEYSKLYEFVDSVSREFASLSSSYIECNDRNRRSDIEMHIHSKYNDLINRCDYRAKRQRYEELYDKLIPHCIKQDPE